MGVIKRGLLGGFSGKVANVVGSSWKGIAVIKSLPLSVANPKTAGQVTQRSYMSEIVSFAKEILVSMIKPLNDRFASGQSGYNLFVQRNIQTMAGDIQANFTDLVVSSGTLPPLTGASITRSATNNRVTIDYDDVDLGPNGLASDEIYAFFKNFNTGEVVSRVAQDTRGGSGSLQINSTEGFTVADQIGVCIMTRRADGTQVSNTQATIGAAA